MLVALEMIWGEILNLFRCLHIMPDDCEVSQHVHFAVAGRSSHPLLHAANLSMPTLFKQPNLRYCLEDQQTSSPALSYFAPITCCWRTWPCFLISQTACYIGSFTQLCSAYAANLNKPCSSSEYIGHVYVCSSRVVSPCPCFSRNVRSMSSSVMELHALLYPWIRKE